MIISKILSWSGFKIGVDQLLFLEELALFMVLFVFLVWRVHLGEYVACLWFLYWVKGCAQLCTDVRHAAAVVLRFDCLQRFVFTFWTFASWYFGVDVVVWVNKVKIGWAALAFETSFRGTLFQWLSWWVALKRPLDFLVDFIDLPQLRSKQSLVCKLKIPKEEFLLRGRYEMLAHQSRSKFLLIISKFVLVEVKLVIGGNVGRFQLLRQHWFRVDPSNPRVKQYLLQTLQWTYSHFGVFVQQTWQQILDLVWQFNVFWEGQVLINYCTFNLFLVSGVKRRQTRDKFIKKGSKGVKVNTVRMPTFLNHLRRHVLSTTAKAVGDLSRIKTKFGQSKISNFDMPIMINQQIFRFKIPVYDILLMQIHEAIENFNEVEFGIILWHSLYAFEVVEKLASWAILIAEKVQSRTKQTKLWVSKQWLSLTMKGWFSISMIDF